MQIKDDAKIEFTLTGGDTFKVSGLPFYIKDNETSFDKAFKKEFNVSAW